MTHAGVNELNAVFSPILQARKTGQLTCPRSLSDEEVDLGFVPR